MNQEKVNKLLALGINDPVPIKSQDEEPVDMNAQVAAMEVPVDIGHLDQMAVSAIHPFMEQQL